MGSPTMVVMLDERGNLVDLLPCGQLSGELRRWVGKALWALPPCHALMWRTRVCRPSLPCPRVEDLPPPPQPWPPGPLTLLPPPPSGLALVWRTCSRMSVRAGTAGGSKTASSTRHHTLSSWGRQTRTARLVGEHMAHALMYGNTLHTHSCVPVAGMMPPPPPHPPHTHTFRL